MSFNSNASLKSKVYGLPIVNIGVIYLIAQLVLSIIFMALSSLINYVLPVLIYSVLLSAVVIGIISTVGVTEEIIAQDNKVVQKTVIFRTLQAEIKAIFENCNNAELSPIISKLNDEFKYSDPVSNDATSEIENQLVDLLSSLSSAVMYDDVVQIKEIIFKLSTTLNKRNTICKLNK